MSENGRQITAAGPPFDHPDADIILRSSDTEEPTDFRIFKLLLSLASPFFASAFTLPQPADDSDDVPIMEMQEDRHTLEMILGLCYPISVQEPPRFTTLRDLRRAIQAANKFEMEGVQRHLKKVLVESRFIESQPLQVFAVACRHGWLEEARVAARYSLRHPMDTTLFEELELITAGTYRRLMQYRKECGEAGASEVLRHTLVRPANSPWSWDSYESQYCTLCGGPRRWWLGWMHNVADAIRERPWGQIANNEDLKVRGRHLIGVDVCDTCSSDVAEDLEDFILVLSAKIDKKILTVRLSLRLER
ncbi:hypothetical protein DXG01_002864 [Tephrocybe rancida]|nr:hypothetical protein DXG01_002864 [Tephrocybe rancida]